ncbi:lactate dehydrogenase-like 2-hydroxyacid dehydrogenase [Rhodobacteraceae bacterium MBR-64]
MTRILISRRLPDAAMNAVADLEVTLRDTPDAMTHDEVVAALCDYDGVIPTLGDPFDAQAFAKVPQPRCKVVANFGAGYNHIDVAAALGAGVVVTNTPGAVTDATADIALMLMLMVARRAGEGERMVRAGNWHGWQPTQMLGLHLTGKTLGIIGMGRIGKAIARRAQRGFDMDVVFFNRSRVADCGVPARQLDSLAGVMGVSDVVVVAVPGGKATHHLIDAAAFAAMRPSAIFVNIARGDIVDEAALIAALQAGRIAGAGLDVYEFEPQVPAALRAMENVVLLPHLGTAALEVRTAMAMMAIDNLRAVLAGQPAPNAVTV